MKLQLVIFYEQHIFSLHHLRTPLFSSTKQDYTPSKIALFRLACVGWNLLNHHIKSSPQLSFPVLISDQMPVRDTAAETTLNYSTLIFPPELLSTLDFSKIKFTQMLSSLPKIKEFMERSKYNLRLRWRSDGSQLITLIRIRGIGDK